MALQLDTDYYHLDLLQRSFVNDAVMGCFNSAKDKGESEWMKHGDPFVAACHIAAVLDHRIDHTHWRIFNGVLIVWTFGVSWWSTDCLAQEELVLGVIPGFDVTAALAKWEAELKRYGCKGIVLGTSLAGDRSGALARLYRQRGYTHAAHILTKEL